MGRTRTTGIAKLAGIGIVALGLALGTGGTSSSASPMKGWTRGDIGSSTTVMGRTAELAAPPASIYQPGYLRGEFTRE